MKHVLAILGMTILDALSLVVVIELMRQPGDWNALLGLVILAAMGVLSIVVFGFSARAIREWKS